MLNLIRKLKENVDCIPQIFWRRYFNSDEGTIWLIEGKFGMKRNGNIVIKGNRRYEVRTFKTFNLNPTKFSREEENQIKKTINEYLLFYKDKNKTLTARDMISCENLEIRQVLLRKYGYEKFVNELKGIRVHSDKFGELIKLNWKKKEMMKFVKVKDASTDRVYIIRVPPNVKTCKEGVAWTFGLREEEYQPQKET